MVYTQPAHQRRNRSRSFHHYSRQLAALHDGDQYLVDRYSNVIITLASYSRLKDQPSPVWRGLGLGVSKPAPGFAPLSHVADELRAIVRAEGAAGQSGVLEGRILLDEAFTAEAMQAELRRRYPAVHIASHFKIAPGNETDSFLLLGDGAQLTLAEIKTWPGLFSGVDLLTLSACDTGVGGDGGDGREVESFGEIAQRKRLRLAQQEAEIKERLAREQERWQELVEQARKLGIEAGEKQK